MNAITEAPVSQTIADLEDGGLLGEFPEGPRLIGSQCNSCGRTMIGTRVVCSSCVSRDINRIALPTTGVLYSFTRIHMGADGVRPMGYVDLENGVRTLAEIREDIELVPDMRVELGVNGDAWFFAPETKKEDNHE